jgi:two-component system NtrC family sensor kinase
MDEQIRILFVDDERNVLRSLQRIFLDEDYEILTASSGAEGIAVLQSITPIQLIISDYRMPKMNGVDFLREVCNRWPETIRIVLSGYADTASIVSAINEGYIYKFIAKPWNEDELKITIVNAIESYYLDKENKQLASF